MTEHFIDPSKDYVADLCKAQGGRWPSIAAAYDDALAVRQLLFEELRQFTSDDVDVVVFGSLARGEWTRGSDVDWTMLIDGQADSYHKKAASHVERALAELEYNGMRLRGPGAEGIFGNMAFSHDIVHHIGGQADTNHNTTQRILLLLEASALRARRAELGGPLERVLRQILNRYLASDSNFHSQTDNESRIPRFLLNDIVRYWRTMCVDFAYKDWEQAGKKWALRNIKLRTSRKLLFVAGLLTVYSCFHNPALRREKHGREEYLFVLQDHLLRFVQSTPLGIVVWSLTRLALEDSCFELLDSYDHFLRLMNDEKVRDHLAGLSEESVYSDAGFLEFRNISHRLQSTLKTLFFEVDSPLREFTFEYGVF